MLGKCFQGEGARDVQSDYQQREEVAQLEKRVVKEHVETRGNRLHGAGGVGLHCDGWGPQRGQQREGWDQH